MNDHRADGARERSLLRSLHDWLEERTGLPGIASDFLGKPLPPGVGWLHVLGSALLFLIAVQLATGAFLVLYYAPTPDHARASIVFLETQRFGALIRALHVWGASLTVVLLIAHAFRVFVAGAYRPPRDATWMTGAALLLLIGAFAFTGYLLPWDEKGYWATVVGTEAIGTTPGLGTRLLAYVRGSETIGALTLSRFFAAHVVFLPAALVTLLVAHLFLVRRHGPAGDETPHTATTFPFYPRQMWRDTIAVTAVFVALILLASVAPPRLGAPADPGGTAFVPRPEWYFLFLFQLLKVFEGPLEILGTVVLPGLGATLLVFLPLLERRRRGGMIGRGVLATGIVGTWITLTTLGWMDRGDDTPGHIAGSTVTPLELAGRSLADELACARCHTTGGSGGELSGWTGTRSPDWLRDHFQNPSGTDAEETRVLIEEESEAIERFVTALRERQPAVLQATPLEVRGGRAFFDNVCIDCHTIHGGGGDQGPDLTRVAEKHSRAWIREQILHPRRHQPDGEMPAYDGKIGEAELRVLLDYLAPAGPDTRP